MNISYELYRIFHKVAIHGSISKASIELMISQPAISKSIKNLESSLGGALFTRTKKGVTLTEEGNEFFKHIDQAIFHINNAEHRFNELISLETGKITIGSSSVLLTSKFLMPFLSEFHKLYPKIAIEIVTNEIPDLMAELRNGVLDVLLLISPLDDYSDIKTIKCKNIQDCFIVSKNFPELIGKNIKLETLKDYPLLLPVLKFNDRKILDEHCINNSIHFKPFMELTSFTLIKDYARAGFGVGIVSEILIEDELKNKELYKINIEPNLPNRSICIIHLKNKEPSFSVQKLIDIVNQPKR